MCAIVQCCWSEGLPNARQLNFGVGSIKKKNLHLNHMKLRFWKFIGLTNSLQESGRKKEQDIFEKLFLTCIKYAACCKCV